MRLHTDTATDYLSTVYVINWTPDSMGGFEWRADRDAAVAFMREIADPTARLYTVAVPEHLSTDPAGITDWLDADGWSDGVDPRGFRPLY